MKSQYQAEKDVVHSKDCPTKEILTAAEVAGWETKQKVGGQATGAVTKFSVYFNFSQLVQLHRSSRGWRAPAYLNQYDRF